MTPSMLKAFLELGREYRLKHIKLEGMEIEFGPHVTPLSPEDLAKLGVVKIGEEHGNPTEDEFLFMSSPDGHPAYKTEPPQ